MGISVPSGTTYAYPARTAVRRPGALAASRATLSFTYLQAVVVPTPNPAASSAKVSPFEDLEVSWEKYRDDIVDNADRNRLYLHASRVLGVFAAVFIAALAIVAVVAGTVAPAPSDVIVVHNGQLTCGPVVDSTKYTDVTNVVPVTSC
jgi:hypothetical protein